MGSVEELMSHIGLVRVLVDDVDVVRMLEKISETLKKIIDGVSDPYNREFKVSEDRTELLEDFFRGETSNPAGGLQSCG